MTPNSPNTMPSAETGSVTLYLLDSAQGHPIQTWQFRDRAKVTIGRLPDNDIAIVDPQVSRCHLELRFANGKWTLVGLGRNGTIVNGESVSEIEMRDHWVFQLGTTGPTFKFVVKQELSGQYATIDNLEGISLDFLTIDQQRKQEDVQQIADAEAFRLLQEQVRQLKRGASFDKTQH